MVFGKDFEPAYSHQATRKELDKQFGKGWIGWVELARKLRLARRTLTALIQRGVISQGTRIGAYRVWSHDEFKRIFAQIEDLRSRAETAYPAQRPDGRWECPACKKVSLKAGGTHLAPLVRHVATCPDLWARLDRANEFGEV